jgi:hypothetical protein
VVKKAYSKDVLDFLKDIARRGAEARNRRLSPERRKEIARRAAEARWSRKKKAGPQKARPTSESR